MHTNGKIQEHPIHLADAEWKISFSGLKSALPMVLLDPHYSLFRTPKKFEENSIFSHTSLALGLML
jgi:hypothetical protein